MNYLEMNWEKDYYPVQVIVKSDGFFLPPPSLTTLSVTTNVPCTELTGDKACENVLFSIVISCCIPTPLTVPIISANLEKGDQPA